MEPKTVVVAHVEYPHSDGYMFDCPACEYGECVCVNEPTWGPCVSVHCKRTGEEM